MFGESLFFHVFGVAQRRFERANFGGVEQFACGVVAVGLDAAVRVGLLYDAVHAVVGEAQGAAFLADDGDEAASGVVAVFDAVTGELLQQHAAMGIAFDEQVVLARRVTQIDQVACQVVLPGRGRLGADSAVDSAAVVVADDAGGLGCGLAFDVLMAQALVLA